MRFLGRLPLGSRFLLLFASIGLTLGVLSVARVVHADEPCGDGSACTPYTVGTPPIMTHGCAHGTCGSVCASTGGPPTPPPPNGSTGTMVCKCGDTVLNIPCSRKVKWTREPGGYSLEILQCELMPCSFGSCVVRPPCEYVLGHWCSCTGI